MASNLYAKAHHVGSISNDTADKNKPKKA